MSFFLLDHLCPTMLAQPSAQVLIIATDTGTARVMAQNHPEPTLMNRDKAAIFGDVLGIPVRTTQVVPVLNHGDNALVGIYTGPHLTEGRTMLPEGGTINWFHLTVLPLTERT